jgi:capsid protein
MKDASAEILQIEAGLKSRTQAMAERGYDAEQVDREIAAERKREAALGLDFRRPGSPAQGPWRARRKTDAEDQRPRRTRPTTPSDEKPGPKEGA